MLLVKRWTIHYETPKNRKSRDERGNPRVKWKQQQFASIAGGGWDWNVDEAGLTWELWTWTGLGIERWIKLKRLVVQ